MSANKFDLELQTEVLEAKTGKPLPNISSPSENFYDFYRQANSLAKEAKPFSKKEIGAVAQFLKKNASTTDTSEEFARFKLRWMTALEKVYGQSSEEFAAAKAELVMETSAELSVLRKTTPDTVPDIYKPTGQLFELKMGAEFLKGEKYVTIYPGKSLKFYNRDAESQFLIPHGDKIVATGMIGKMNIEGGLRDVAEVRQGTQTYFVVSKFLTSEPPVNAAPSLPNAQKPNMAPSGVKTSPKASNKDGDSSSKAPAKDNTSAPTPSPEADLKRKEKLVSSAPLTLTNGEKVFGIVIEKGQRYFTGSNGKRILFNAKLLPESYRRQEIQSEGARKVESLVDDAHTLLTALANHAAVENWKDKNAFGARVGKFMEFIEKLDYSHEKAAREKIIDFVIASVQNGEALSDEIKEFFRKEDSDEVRRKKVYNYIRGGFDPRSIGAGFTGGSEYIAQKLSAQELAKKNITPEVMEKMVSRFLDTDWRSKKPKEIAQEMIAQKAQSPAWAFIIEAYGEKGIADFAEKFIDTNKELEKVYNSEQVNKQFNELKVDGKTPSAEDISKFKVNSKKAKLMTLMSEEIVEKYAKTHDDERKTNTTLDTFANIKGIGWNISDKTLGYVRNDLWKDAAIEVAALAAGTVSLGAGAMAIQMIQAGRWGNRALHGFEAISMANKVGKSASLYRFGARTIANGALFEFGNSGVRTAVASKQNGEFTNMYSVEGFVQSAAFMGAFWLVEKTMAQMGVKISRDIPLLNQKAALSKLMAADVATSIGMSFGIAKYQGENWTLEEVLQAAAMAMLFRGTSSYITVRKLPSGGVEVNASQTPSTPAAPAAPVNRTSAAAAPSAPTTPATSPAATPAAAPSTTPTPTSPVSAAAPATPSPATPATRPAEGSRTPNPSAPESTVTTTPATPTQETATNRTQRAPTEVPLSNTTVLEPFMKQLKKTGDSFEVGNVKVTKNADGWIVKNGEEAPMTFLKGDKSAVLTEISKHIQAKDIVVSRMRTVTDAIGKRFKEPRVIDIGGDVFRIEKAVDWTLKVSKKGENSGYRELTPENIGELPETTLIKLFDEINPGLGSKMMGMMKNPVENMSPKVKSMKMGDVFSKASLKKFGKYVWNQSVGDFLDSMKNTWLRSPTGVVDVVKRVPQTFAQIIFGSRVGHDGKMDWNLRARNEQGAIQGQFINFGLLGSAAMFTGVEMVLSKENDNLVNEYFMNIASMNVLGWLGALGLEFTPYSKIPAEVTSKAAWIMNDSIDYSYRKITNQEETK